MKTKPEWICLPPGHGDRSGPVGGETPLRYVGSPCSRRSSCELSVLLVAMFQEGGSAGLSAGLSVGLSVDRRA